MTFATEVIKSTRKPFTAVEVDLERCARSYGVLGCQAVVGITGLRKCFNTNATCQFTSAFTQSLLAEGFGMGAAGNTDAIFTAPNGAALFVPVAFGQSFSVVQPAQYIPTVQVASSQMRQGVYTGVIYFAKAGHTQAWVAVQVQPGAGSHSGFSYNPLTRAVRYAHASFSNITTRDVGPDVYELTFRYTPALSQYAGAGPYVFSANYEPASGPWLVDAEAYGAPTFAQGGGTTGYVILSCLGIYPGPVRPVAGPYLSGASRVTTFRFTDQEVPPYGPVPVIQRTMLRKVETVPGRLDLGGATLGQREGGTITLIDGTGDDILADDYLESRRGTVDQGWLLAKTVARWRYLAGRELRIYDGFLDDYGQVIVGSLRLRTYLIDSWTGPDGAGKHVIKVLDPLRGTSNTRAQYPTATLCPLTVAALIGDATLTVSTTFGLDAAGYLRLEDEIIQYTSITATTIVGCIRGVGGTTAVAHALAKNCQRTVFFNATSPVDVVAAVLTGIGTKSKYINAVAWHAVCDDWIELTAVTAYVSAPEDVDKLLAEICQSWLLILYYDSEAAAIRLEPARPPSTQQIINLSDDLNILAGSLATSEKTDQRINQVWIYYGVNNWAKAADFSNVTYLTIGVDLNAQSAAQYGDTRPLLIKSRWLSNVTSGQVNSVLTRYLLRFRDAPRRYAFSVDGAAQVKLGSFLTVLVANVQDPTGLPSSRNMRAVEVGSMVGGNLLSVVAEDDFFQGKYAFYMTDLAPDYSLTNPSLNVGGGFYCSDFDLMPNGDDPFRYA